MLFGAASIWQIAIKARLRRADFDFSPETIVAAAIRIGFTELPVYTAEPALVAYSELVEIIGRQDD